MARRDKKHSYFMDYFKELQAVIYSPGTHPTLQSPSPSARVLVATSAVVVNFSS